MSEKVKGVVDKKFYNTTLCQVFSPNGDYLVIGNIYGELVVFDIANVLNSAAGVQPNLKPIFQFMAPREKVFSLASTEKFLIIGAVGEITGWDWDSIYNKHPKMLWSMHIPPYSDSYGKPDVNSMVLSEISATGSTLLYVGCGDNNIYVFDMEDGKCLRTFEGHEDYIHSISKLNNQLASAGEDGTVRLWDLRLKAVTSIIEPHKNRSVERHPLGKWVGDVDLSDDWMVCGGGPRLSLWHLRTLECMSSFDSVKDSGLHITRFYEDKIIAGGTAPSLYHLSLNGELSAQVQVSQTTVYSVCIQESPHHVMCIAGSSPKIDVCTNFNYREQVLSLV